MTATAEMTITTQDTMIRMYRKKALMFETVDAFENKNEIPAFSTFIRFIGNLSSSPLFRSSAPYFECTGTSGPSSLLLSNISL